MLVAAMIEGVLSKGPPVAVTATRALTLITEGLLAQPRAVPARWTKESRRAR
jgi:hypothetical protein